MEERTGHTAERDELAVLRTCLAESLDQDEAGFLLHRLVAANATLQTLACTACRAWPVRQPWTMHGVLI